MPDYTPTRGYSFAGFQASQPASPLPGANVDQELDRAFNSLTDHYNYFAQTIAPDGSLVGQVVSDLNLQDGVLDAWTTTIQGNIQPSVDAAAASAAAALASQNAAGISASNAAADLVTIQGYITQAQVLSAAAQAAQAQAITSEAEATAQAGAAAASAGASATSASSARLAEDMAYRWAEQMSGPVYVPFGGDPIDDGFYSAKYWATSVTTQYDDITVWYNEISVWHAEIEAWQADWEQFRTTYYGSLAANPTLDPLGGAITTGDLYFNSVANEMRVWNGSSWVDFAGVTPLSLFTDLSDTPVSYTGAAGKFVKVNPTEDGVVYEDFPAVPTAFTDLTDTPASFAGSADFLVSVNGAENALTFISQTSLPYLLLAGGTVTGGVAFTAGLGFTEATNGDMAGIYGRTSDGRINYYYNDNSAGPEPTIIERWDFDAGLIQWINSGSSTIAEMDMTPGTGLATAKEIVTRDKGDARYLQLTDSLVTDGPYRADIDQNAADILTNAAAILANTGNISTNASNIATNTSNIATNVTNIAANAALLATAVQQTRQVLTSNGLTGGGNLSADRTLQPDYATQAEAEAGTEAAKVMSPLRVAQAMASLAGITHDTNSPKATTSGTSIDYTSLPSGLTFFLIALYGTATYINSSANDFMFQLGDSGGMKTSGYLTGRLHSGGGASDTSGFRIRYTQPGKGVFGVMAFLRLSGNQWSGMGGFFGEDDRYCAIAGGVTLTNELDRFRLTTAAGINNFTAGNFALYY